MTVRTFTPQMRVTIRKSILRREGRSERYPGSGGAGPVIDITPYLSDRGRVFISKNLYQPMGAFSLVVADRPSDDYLDTLYGLIEPMDTVEIRLARSPEEYGGVPPVIMRGFVEAIRRNETMSDDGTPQRVVVISGSDYGLMFTLVRIIHLLAYVTGINLLSGFPFWEMTGIEKQPLTPGQWIDLLLQNVLNPALASFAVASDSVPVVITSNVTVTDGVIWPRRDYEGTLWELMLAHSDQPWNELFIRDTDAGVEVVHRPLPFRDATVDRAWIPQGAQTIELPESEIIPVGIDEVSSLNAGRTDSHIANLYWVDHPLDVFLGGSNLLFASAIQNQDRATIFLDDAATYPNSDPRLYGARPMRVATQFGWTGMATDGVDLPESQQMAARGSMLDWLRRKRLDLIALNKDNVVFESGEMVLRGNERLRAGRYIDLTRHKMRSIYYLYEVVHQFIPFRAYTTTCRFIRGTGFLDRSRSDSPYTDEGKGGVYD